MRDRLNSDFFARPTRTVARAMLGQTLVSIVRGKRRAGIIVETEAYLGVKDKAAHTYTGRRTERTEPMWAKPGTAYVYFTYGMHHCMNIATCAEGVPEAVLIRALEPVDGIEPMRRARSGDSSKRVRDQDLCSGPARLCQALAVDRKLSGVDTQTSERLWLERAGQVASRHIVTTARVGIDSAADWATKPLRFYIEDNPHVSRGKPSTGGKKTRRGVNAG